MSERTARPVPHTGEVAALLVAAVLVVVAVVAGVVVGAGSSGRATAAVTAVGVVVVVVHALVALTVVQGRRWRGGRRDDARGGAIEPVPTPDGAVLHSEADGPDDALVTVVFVHDLLLDLTSWRAQRAALVTAGQRVVLYDQRGHGLSAAAPLGGEGSRAAVLADDLDAVLAARVPSGRVVLVGHGLGAMAVQTYATRHPERFADRVAGTVLVGAATGPLRDRLGVGASGAPARRWYPALLALLGRLPGTGRWAFPVQRIAARRLAGHKGVAPEVVRDVVAASSSVRPATAADFLLAALEHDERSGALSLSRRPVVAVVPGADRFVPVAAQAALRASVPGARIVRIADCGHAAPVERPDVVTQQLRAMLTAVTGGDVAMPARPAPSARPRARTLAEAELVRGETAGLLSAAPAEAGLLRTARPEGDGLLAAPVVLPDLLQKPRPRPPSDEG
ncbi:MAG: alpha/beta fold hydrolase [Jatrophihabitans sp.]|uniref:alpha/beta fold hydrolase n=1 Tax=Jatrophihabitans sp. TaxID=1932789 RepID=UPI003F812789